MLPYNRIREVIELEVKYENRQERLGREEEEGVDVPESAMCAKTLV